MIEFLSNWAKGLGLAIIVVSILEMLLPNGKNKKYVRTVMGVYVMFSIITPFIENSKIFAVSEIDFNKYIEESNIESIEIDQSSMNSKIQKLYISEMEKDIKQKIENKGYIVIDCKVSANIQNTNEESRVTKIELDVEKNENIQENNKKEIIHEEGIIENIVVDEIQKIKSIDVYVGDDKKNKEDKENKENKNKEEKRGRITTVDIQNIKKILIEEYGVNEKCLEIK